jgi:long-chain acyl-CoA synthetase
VSVIKRWVIIDNDFMVETGELTPTQKVKRNFVYKKHEDKIRELYEIQKFELF